MNILLAIDVQKEFSNNDGNYERIVNFINNAKEYDKIVATRYLNTLGSNFVKYLNYTKCIDGVYDLEFNPDLIIDKYGYGLKDYSIFSKENHYDLIGLNTDACVLKISFDLFDLGYDFNILTDYCYSSSGLDAHLRGIEVMKSVFGSIVK